MGWQYNQEIAFNKPARAVDVVFLHCSASDNPNHDSVEVIQRWHKNRGFTNIGYHFFISKNGHIHDGRSLENTPAAQKGYNKGSIAICLHGLKPERFTQEQFNSVYKLCSAIKAAYGDTLRFRGHKEVAAKACPVFDYKTVLGLDAQGYMTGSQGQAPAASASGSTSGTVLQLLSHGPEVRKLQTWLSSFGLTTAVDGYFGQATHANVVKLQTIFGLQADGIVGSKTKALLQPLKQGVRGPIVRWVQKQLVAAGQKIKIDGHFGAKTKEAIKSFQKQNRLLVDGIVGPKTYGKLHKTK